MSLKEINDSVTKKVSILRMKSSFLKHALNKKFRKVITEKIMAIFEQNFSNMN